MGGRGRERERERHVAFPVHGRDPGGFDYSECVRLERTMATARSSYYYLADDSTSNWVNYGNFHGAR